jgi:hypothetical protein
MEFKFALFENSSLNVRPKSELVNDGKNNRLNFRGKSKLYGQKKLGEKITSRKKIMTSVGRHAFYDNR